jgi:hypothetical protein
LNYLISPNNSYDTALLADTQTTVRAMEDTGHEPDVYGVELYGERPVDLTPEKVNVNGVDQEPIRSPVLSAFRMARSRS